MGMVGLIRFRTIDAHVIDVRVLALRLVDNKAVLYFDAPTPSEALNWYRGKQVSSDFSLGEALI